MSSTDRLSVLRERNKELLRQLRKQSERLQQRTSIQSLVDSLDEAKENGTHNDVMEMMTLIDGNRGQARAALAKPTVSFKDYKSSAIQTEALSRAAGTCKTTSAIQCETSTPPLTPKHRKGTVDYHTVSSEHFKDGNRRPAIHYRPQEKRKPVTSSVLLDQDRDRREVGSRVTFHSPEWEQISASESDRRRVQPLLGYDWIAGLLDVESSLTECSEEFFNDLRTFRAVNRDECVHSQQVGFPEEDHSVLPLLRDEEARQPNMDTHQCTFCYKINSRLFATPLDPQECCPVCKKLKSIHPHTTAEPAFIRVSIPHSTLLPSYKYKAHRRCSFDPSDSLGLPSHCLSGWSNTGQSTAAQPSSLDLRSCLNVETPTSFHLAQSQNKEHLDLSVSRVSGSQRSDQILDVSRLARYRLQHLSPKSQLYSTSYPVY